LSKYREQFERVKRWHDKLEALDAYGVYDVDPIESTDVIYAFFMNCHHLRDWIENDEDVQRQLGRTSSACDLTTHVSGNRTISRDSPRNLQTPKWYGGLREFDRRCSRRGLAAPGSAAHRLGEVFRRQKRPGHLSSGRAATLSKGVVEGLQVSAQSARNSRPPRCFTRR
jgi:hypothetical protein